MTVAVHHDIPELDAAGLRRFGLVTGGVVAGLFGLALPWLVGFPWPAWPWMLAAVLGAWGLAAPAGLGPVYRGWMRFGLLMGRVVTPLVLGTVFFAVITPAALVMKVIRRDSMCRALDERAETYRVPSVKARRESMERPY